MTDYSLMCDGFPGLHRQSLKAQHRDPLQRCLLPFLEVATVWAALWTHDLPIRPETAVQRVVPPYEDSRFGPPDGPSPIKATVGPSLRPHNTRGTSPYGTPWEISYIMRPTAV